MTYRGKFTKGTVVLPPEVNIPEGTEVEVIPLSEEDRHDAQPLPTLAERFRRFTGRGKRLPRDIAKNHDHYLYGTRKK